MQKKELDTIDTKHCADNLLYNIAQNYNNGIQTVLNITANELIQDLCSLNKKDKISYIRKYIKNGENEIMLKKAINEINSKKSASKLEEKIDSLIAIK